MGLNKRLIDQAGGAAGVTNTDNFDLVTYYGNGGTKSITSLDFQPDLVWVKKRSGGTARDHMVYDSIRGAGYRLRINQTYAESYASNELTSFDTNGFSLGVDDATNGSTYPYVAWCWKGGGAAVSNTNGSITSQVSANPDAGFSIVKYTGNGNADASVGHGLSSAPELYILRRYDITGTWIVLTNVIDGSMDYLVLNTNAAKVDAGQTAPTSSVLNIKDYFGNISSATYIAYCFHSVDGYQKVGSYTGSYTTKTVTTGFRPSFLMVKGTSSFRNWCVFDTKRPNDVILYPNLSNQETDLDRTLFTPTDTGFELGVGDDFNASGNTYIYLAIA